MHSALIIWGFRSLRFLGRGDADEFADRALKLIGQSSPVLGAVDGVEESLGSAAIAPVHRGIRRGSEGHVGIGEQADKDRDKKQQTLPPLGELATHNDQEEEPSPHCVEEPDSSLHRHEMVLVGGEVGKAQVEKACDQNAVDCVFPKEFCMQQQDDHQRHEGHGQSHVVIAHPKAENEDQPDKGILPVRPSYPEISKHQIDHHQADMECVESLSDNRV